MSVKRLIIITRPLVTIATILFYLAIRSSLSWTEVGIIVIGAIILIPLNYLTYSGRTVAAGGTGSEGRLVSEKRVATVPVGSITMLFVLAFGGWLDHFRGIILGFIVGLIIARIFAGMCFRSLKKDQAVLLDFIRTKTNVDEADITANSYLGWSGRIYLRVTLLNQTLRTYHQRGEGRYQRLEDVYKEDTVHDIRLQGETLRGDAHSRSSVDSEGPGPGSAYEYTYIPDEDGWHSARKVSIDASSG